MRDVRWPATVSLPGGRRIDARSTGEGRRDLPNLSPSGAADIAVSPRFDAVRGGDMASDCDLLRAMTQQRRKMEQVR
jgi:hypothetical protein